MSVVAQVGGRSVTKRTTNLLAGTTLCVQQLLVIGTSSAWDPSVEVLYETCSGADDGPWRQGEVLKGPRVQLENGLDCTKENPTSVPTTRWESSLAVGPTCAVPASGNRVPGRTGQHCTTRMWGVKDKDVQIWRVTGVFTPVPFADADPPGPCAQLHVRTPMRQSLQPCEWGSPSSYTPAASQPFRRAISLPQRSPR